jgi:O-antigen/teichoic acid export membrane protein
LGWTCFFSLTYAGIILGLTIWVEVVHPDSREFVEVANLILGYAGFVGLIILGVWAGVYLVQKDQGDANVQPQYLSDGKSEDSIRKLFISGFWLWVPGLGALLFPQGLILLIAWAGNLELASQFSVAYSLSLAGGVLFFPLAYALFPWAAGKGQDIRNSEPELNRSFKAVMALSTCLGIALAAAAPFLLGFYGTSYSAEGWSLRWLACAQITEAPRTFSHSLLGGGGAAGDSFTLESARILIAFGCIALLLSFGGGLIEVSAALFFIQFAVSWGRLWALQIRYRLSWNRIFLVYVTVGTAFAGLAGQIFP